MIYIVGELNNTITSFPFHYEMVSKEDEETATISLIIGEPMQIIDCLPDDLPTVINVHTMAQIAVHPSGKWLYTSNRGHDVLSHFDIDVDGGGMLTRATCVPSGGETPRFFTISPSGTSLLCANQDSGNITVFTIDPINGKLSETSRVNVDLPVWMDFIPQQKSI